MYSMVGVAYILYGVIANADQCSRAENYSQSLMKFEL